MRTRGEIESAVSDGMTRFEQEHMGRGPKHIRSYLLGDLLVVRLRGVLTEAEKQLVKSVPPEKGRNLLKQVRIELMEAARPLVAAMVEGVTGSRVVSMHRDISTVTGEEVVLFTLAEAPAVRESRSGPGSARARFARRASIKRGPRQEGSDAKRRKCHGGERGAPGESRVPLPW